MLIKFTTDKSVSATASALQAAVRANRFAIMKVHNLKQIMTQNGLEFDRDCLIYEVCQPQQAKKILDQNLGVSTALPCRISLYEENGKTVLATLKPTALLAIFTVPRLESVARDVENTLTNIMKEAALN